MPPSTRLIVQFRNSLKVSNSVVNSNDGAATPTSTWKNENRMNIGDGRHGNFQLDSLDEKFLTFPTYSRVCDSPLVPGILSAARQGFRANQVLRHSSRLLGRPLMKHRKWFAF